MSNNINYSTLATILALCMCVSAGADYTFTTIEHPDSVSSTLSLSPGNHGIRHEAFRLLPAGARFPVVIAQAEGTVYARRSDHDGAFPPHVEFHRGPRGKVSGTSHPFWGEDDWPKRTRGHQFRLGFLAEYVGSEMVYHCPSFEPLGFKVFLHDGADQKNHSATDHPIHSYSLNLFMMGWDSRSTSGYNQKARVDPPADIILGSDGTGLNNHMWWPGATPGYGGPAPGSWYEDPLYNTHAAPYARHLGTCNFLFNDGSVLRELIKKYWYDEYWTY